MKKSLSEFASLPPAELMRMVSDGPLLITHNEEPRFVAQSIDAFEAMVRRLRALETARKRREHFRQVIPFRR